jgi:1,4-dihydroxy-2-naphthoate octaprenyltransferase
MTPGELSTVAAFVQIITSISGWPFGMIIFIIVIGPWIAAFLLVYFQSRRFEKVVTMYEKNVNLVEDYANLVEDYAALAKDLHDVVIMNTQAMTQLVDSIKTNQYCPAIRLEKKAGGPQL